jgi:hypothetical protein
MAFSAAGSTGILGALLETVVITSADGAVGNFNVDIYWGHVVYFCAKNCCRLWLGLEYLKILSSSRFIITRLLLLDFVRISIVSFWFNFFNRIFFPDLL